MRFLILIFYVSTAVLLLNNCHSTDPKLEPELVLKLEDVSCTEAWLQLTTNNIQLPATINLLKNNTVTQTFSLSTQDSLLYIDSLLPNQNYKLIAAMQQGNNVSNELSVTTLDTTSHNFTWQTFTFGEHQHSVLYDVAIINENNIWAVGEIYMYDSLGIPDPNAYNAVHWNGQSWELKRINMLSNCNPVIYPPLKAIWAFDENNIVLTSGGSIGWFDGNINRTDCTIRPLLTGSINKLWGSNSNDLYAVGNNGNIAHYNDSRWTKIESGTSVNLYDVWRTTDRKTIWTCGYTDDYGTSALIKIKDGIAEKVFEGLSNSQNNGYYVGPMSGVWSDNEYRVFMMNWSGIYLQQNNNQFFLEKEIAKFSDAGFGIDGTAYNSVFACGEGFVGHWNGYSYQEYPELLQQQRTFKSVKANANIVCAVGLDYNSPIYSNAVIVLGK